MRLGIVVVYMIKNEDQGLLEIHLDQIERNTSIPYKIYCVVKKTSPTILAKLKNNPKINILNTKTPGIHGGDKKSSLEHTVYLRRLTDWACQDDITHLAIFHLDSFPIRTNWAEDLAKITTGNCVLAAITRVEDKDNKPHCSGMFFPKDFYVQYQPTYRLSEKIMKKSTYRQYCEANNHHIIPDTGVGFGYRLFIEKHLSWCRLTRSNKKEDHKIMGGIYGNVFFHLGGATRKINRKDYRIACDLSKQKLLENPTAYLNHLRGL